MYSLSIKSANDLMLICSLNGTIDQLAMANSIRCYGQVLRSENVHVLRKALDLEVEGQRMN